MEKLNTNNLIKQRTCCASSLIQFGYAFGNRLLQRAPAKGFCFFTSLLKKIFSSAMSYNDLQWASGVLRWISELVRKPSVRQWIFLILVRDFRALPAARRDDAVSDNRFFDTNQSRKVCCNLYLFKIFRLESIEREHLRERRWVSLEYR